VATVAALSAVLLAGLVVAVVLSIGAEGDLPGGARSRAEPRGRGAARA
jgi:hypothetical protein